MDTTATTTKWVKGSDWTKRRCRECGKRFDLMEPDQEQEWYFGHDCEA